MVHSTVKFASPSPSASSVSAARVTKRSAAGRLEDVARNCATRNLLPALLFFFYSKNARVAGVSRKPPSRKHLPFAMDLLCPPGNLGSVNNRAVNTRVRSDLL